MMNSRIYSIQKGDEPIYYAILERFNWSKRQETKMGTLHPLVFQGTILLHADDDGNVTKMRTHKAKCREMIARDIINIVKAEHARTDGNANTG